MPEFQRRKRRSLTDEQLFEEYRRTDEPKKKGRQSGAPPKKQKPAGEAPSAKKSPPAAGTTPAREKPPVSPLRREMQEEQRHEPLNKREGAPDKAPPKKKSPLPKKSPPKKAPARRKRGKMTLYYVLIGIVAVAAVSILSVTVLFNISSFQVIGETSYTDEEIIAACGIEKGNNLLRINIGNAEEQIVSKLVYIDSARISRGFPNRLVITVEPAHPAVSFASGGSYYVISERGRLLEIDRVSSDTPVVKGYSPAADAAAGSQLEDDDEDRMSIALQMIAYMEQYGLNKRCEIDLTDTLNITMSYDGRIEMELGAATRMEDKFYHASLLLEDEISLTERCILILSNPDRVVKRPVYDTEPDDLGAVTTEPEEEPPEEEPENTDGEGNSD